jgi:two-component system chemotaxis response regulator CheB
MIKVVVIDDSAFVRNWLTMLLEKDPSIKVIATAKDGLDGIDAIRKHDPDVVTLDIEMPRMNGLEALAIIMKEMPRPVVMVSSLTSEGAEATLKAMELGAADYIAKKPVIDNQYQEDILKRIYAVAKGGASIRTRKLIPLREMAPSAPAASPAQPLATGAAAVRPVTRPTSEISVAKLTMPAGRAKRDIVAIGVSTGGPPAVQKILAALPADFPAAILIAQHMPAAFTGPFAARLNSNAALTVKEAQHGEKISVGTVYISPGGQHITIKPNMDIAISPEPASELYKPSATLLMESVGKAFGHRALGVMLTGMGSDGLEGAKVFKQQGGRLIAQSEQTCVVYGMPKAVVDAGITDEIVDLDNISQAMIDGLFK